MTQHPEAALAAELGMGYASLSFVTDMDAGAVDGDAVDVELVMRRLADARPRITAAIAATVERIPGNYEPRRLIAHTAIDLVLRRDAS